MEEISDIKTAVSEAVTNAVIHGYEEKGGIISDVYKRQAQVRIYQEITKRGGALPHPRPLPHPDEYPFFHPAHLHLTYPHLPRYLRLRLVLIITHPYQDCLLYTSTTSSHVIISVRSFSVSTTAIFCDSSVPDIFSTLCSFR